MSFTGLLAVLFEVEYVLNNRPLCFVYDDDVSDVLTPNYLLYGRNLDCENKIVEEIDFGVIEVSDLWERKVALQNVVEHLWSVCIENIYVVYKNKVARVWVEEQL